MTNFEGTPVFDTTGGTSVTVNEDLVSGANVGLTASASPATRDSASIASYAITTNSSNLFAINPTSGVIVLSGDLDYESSLLIVLLLLQRLRMAFQQHSNLRLMFPMLMIQLL